MRISPQTSGETAVVVMVVMAEAGGWLEIELDVQWKRFVKPCNTMVFDGFCINLSIFCNPQGFEAIGLW